MKHDDVTLVLQGPIAKGKLETYLVAGMKNLKYYSETAKTIISTWKGAKLKPSKKILAKYNIDIIEASEDLYKNMYRDANMNFQVASTLNGLKKVKTKYAIKLRCDESFSDLSKFIQKIKENPEKIVTTNMFFSKNSYDPFHPSDHVIGGTTENMKSMFDYAFKVCQKENTEKQLNADYFGVPDLINRDGNNGVSPETFLCFCYLMSKGIALDLNKSVEIMKENYEVVPLEDMGKFHCKYAISVINNTNYDFYLNNLPQNFLRSMNDL
tara:strand:- start:569 stop:1372 length:804 start_codon:yes stop_codon:yes gene_type:complete